MHSNINVYVVGFKDYSDVSSSVLAKYDETTDVVWGLVARKTTNA